MSARMKNNYSKNKTDFMTAHYCRIKSPPQQS